MTQPGPKTHPNVAYWHALGAEERRALQGVWRILVDHYFQKWIGPGDAVLDVGAGLCNFINRVRARRKVAMDSDPLVAEHCSQEVDFVHADSLSGKDLGGPFDVIFISNFLEHLESGKQVMAFLEDLRPHLTKDGKLLILQPNFELIGAAYFDFIDHKTILTDKSLIEALELTGYEVAYLKRRFLPYTSKSSIPRAPWMVRLYLAFPPVQYFMGKQSFVVARRQSAEKT